MSFDILWNALPTPAFLIGPDNRIAAANSAAESFVLSSSKALIGKCIIGLLNVDTPLAQRFDRVRISHNQMLINDVKTSVCGQKTTTCNVQIAPMSSSDSRLLVLISQRPNADRIRHTGSAKSAIGMAEMLAHEIKNPLAGISGAAQLLAMNLSKQDKEMTDLIVAEVRRVVSLLDQVEQFGNLSPPNRRPVNIHDVADRALKSASLGFATHMNIRQDYDPSLPETYADADQLIQVVLNLLKNAAQASGKQGGEITIRTFFDSSMRLRRDNHSTQALPIQLEIIDNGPGIAPDLVNDIFNPFVSGRKNGTGLGLALVSKIIADNESWIALQTKPGRTVFRISLPKDKG